MSHDERFLKLWLKDLPVSLDYISSLPRYVSKSHFQSTFDDKSCYHHVKLSPDSFTFVGLEWKGWCFVRRPYPLVGRLAPTFFIRSVWRQHVISALLVSPAVSILTTSMSANSLYPEIFKILSGGPIFSWPRLLLLSCVRFCFALDTSSASPNPFLFPRLESGFWVFCLIPASFPYSTR